MTFHIMVDVQVDFMLPSGKLYVPGADKMIPDLLNYLSSLPAEDDVLFTLDTHTMESYSVSKEREQFPLHCEVGTIGHKLVVPTDISRASTYAFEKDVFSMWETDEENSSVYNLWFPSYWYVNSLKSFMSDMRSKHDTVQVSGVASDFCVKQAIEGLIPYDFDIKINGNLCKGINKTIDEVVSDFEGKITIEY